MADGTDSAPTSTQAETSSERLPDFTVLYDSECGLCDKTMQWLIDHDSEGVLHFAPLDGTTADGVRARHPEMPAKLDSVVFVRNDGESEQVHWHSTAILEICGVLPRPWRYARLFRFVPGFLRDLGYRFIAKIRYRVWGKVEMCRVPTPELRARFLP